MPTSPRFASASGMLSAAGKLGEPSSPPGQRGSLAAASGGYTSPLRASHQSSSYKLAAAGGGGVSASVGLGGGAGPATAKLEHVAERFSTFYSTLEQEKQQRRLQERSRHESLADAIAKLEKGLEAEVQRRADADRQLQAHFDAELKAVQERAATGHADLSAAFRTSLEGLTRQVQDLHALVKEEREQRRADIEHLAAGLVGKVNECVAAVEEERAARADGEAKASRQLGHDLLRLSERLDAERGARDAELAALRGEVHEALGSRNTSDERFQAVVLEEIAALKNSLVQEREERVAEDEDIVAAVNDYTRALQDGLRILAADG